MPYLLWICRAGILKAGGDSVERLGQELVRESMGWDEKKKDLLISHRWNFTKSCPDRTRQNHRINRSGLEQLFLAWGPLTTPSPPPRGIREGVLGALD